MIFTYTSITALVGLLLAFEAHRHGDAIERKVTNGMKLLLTLMFGAMVAGQAATFRGWLIVFLMGVGACKVTKMATLFLLDMVGWRYIWKPKGIHAEN